MGKQVLIKLKRLTRIDTESRKLIAEYEKKAGQPLKGANAFVLDLGKIHGRGPIAYCQCKCSLTNDCGGGGGGS
ncbi:MAG TPA: hypothetical protein ACFYD7_04230 [Candidatus Wujingus californicus]|uniref:hypothetical protein n=1 Tax=Candidatus Wujingus californicus TaxID=3367618 RepID=UPI001DE67F1F|nr:hypothetical protein [Planctomycetota bacterium]MDO8094931.1 hypothetical protein [Candidatus Brocadiales bacterium]